MSTFSQRRTHRSTGHTEALLTGAWRARLRAPLVAAVTAGGLAGGAFLLAASPVTAATSAPTAAAGCTAAEAALEEEFGDLTLTGVTSSMVTGWIQRGEAGRPVLHDTARALAGAQVDLDWARELLGYRMEDTIQAQDAEEAARAELVAAQEADPADPDRVADAEAALTDAEEALAAAQAAEEDAEVVVHDAEVEYFDRQSELAQAEAVLQALFDEAEKTVGGVLLEGDWPALRDGLAEVEECQDGGSTPPPPTAPKPGATPAPAKAPVAKPLSGKATFTG